MARRLGKVGFVGTGGGYTGAFSAGMLRAFYEKNVMPSFMHSVSVNTLNFAEFVASGNVTGLLKTWLTLQDMGQNFLFDRLGIPRRMFTTALFSEKGLRTLIFGSEKNKEKEKIPGINEQALVNSPIELAIGLYNESKEFNYELISNHEQRFIENPNLIKPYLLAPCCLPGFLPPQLINGEWYSDGLYPTLEPAIKQGCDTIFILCNDQPPHENPYSGKWYHRVFNAFDTAHDCIMELRIQAALEKYKDYSYLKLEGDNPPKLPIFKRLWSIARSFSQQGEFDLTPHLIVPIVIKERVAGLSTLGFEKGCIKMAIDHGYDCAMETLVKLNV